MDYGEKHHFEDPRDNLNLENWAPERNPRDIGNRAFFSSESENKENSSDDALGQIVDLAPVSLTSQTGNTDEALVANVKNFQPIVGDRFNSNVATEISRAENELSQTGDISSFYDEIRDMATAAAESWAA